MGLLSDLIYVWVDPRIDFESRETDAPVARSSAAALANFRANRRAFWSLWIFLALFVVTLFAEFVANDKPLVVRFEGEWRFPIFRFYSEADFGGEFQTEASTAPRGALPDRDGRARGLPRRSRGHHGRGEGQRHRRRRDRCRPAG